MPVAKFLDRDLETLRVKERSGSETLGRYDCLAARIPDLGGFRMFGGLLLDYLPYSARRVGCATERAEAQWRASLQSQIDFANTDGDALLPTVVHILILADEAQVLGKRDAALDLERHVDKSCTWLDAPQVDRRGCCTARSC